MRRWLGPEKGNEEQALWSSCGGGEPQANEKPGTVVGKTSTGKKERAERSLALGAGLEEDWSSHGGRERPAVHCRCGKACTTGAGSILKGKVNLNV